MADMAHRLFASFVEYNGDPSYVADPKLWASLTDSPRISSYSIFSVLCLLVFAAACMCPVYVSYTVCTYTYDKFSTTEYFFIVCIRRTQHKISFEKKQLEPTKQSAKKASASTVGRCAIIAVSFPSSHFHARTFTAEKEKRETTRTESVHRPFFFFFLGLRLFFCPFFLSSTELYDAQHLDIGLYETLVRMRIMSDEWEPLVSWSLLTKRKKKRQNSHRNFVWRPCFCLYFIFLSRNKRDRREKREKGNFIISQTIASGSFWIETKL